MLVKFKSKAAADLIMYEEHAKQILDLLGKDVSQGIITAEETGTAIAAIEAEIERINQQAEMEDNSVAGVDEQADDYDDKQPVQEPVKFSTRAYPLLEMLRAAHKGGHSIMWGV